MNRPLLRLSGRICARLPETEMLERAGSHPFLLSLVSEYERIDLVRGRGWSSSSLALNRRRPSYVVELLERAKCGLDNLHVREHRARQGIEYVACLEHALALALDPAQEHPGRAGVRAAAWALMLRSIKIRPELASQVTEADAVSVLTGLGYKIRTATPSRLVSGDRVDLLIETFIPPGKS